MAVSWFAAQAFLEDFQGSTLKIIVADIGIYLKDSKGMTLLYQALQAPWALKLVGEQNNAHRKLLQKLGQTKSTSTWLQRSCHPARRKWSIAFDHIFGIVFGNEIGSQRGKGGLEKGKRLR